MSNASFDQFREERHGLMLPVKNALQKETPWIQICKDKKRAHRTVLLIEKHGSVALALQAPASSPRRKKRSLASTIWGGSHVLCRDGET